MSIIIFYILIYYKTRSRIKYGTIIPLFHPPHDLDPGAMRYIIKMGYDSKSLAATIVHIAVRGFLFIEHIPSRWFTGKSYTLRQRTDGDREKTELEQHLLHACFIKSNICELSRNNQIVVQTMSNIIKSHYEHTYAIDYFESNTEYVAIASIVGIAVSLMAIIFVHESFTDVIVWVLLILQGLAHVTMYFIMPMYTQQGQKIKEEIEGFKLFLTTTETERLKVIGTPPTKTPELFERYLPYAIAMDVEEQWSAQFAPIFKELEKAGHAYQPYWYGAGHPFVISDLAFLSIGLGNALNATITESSTRISSSESRPGSSSGSGGSGYSGGGGGGGGGGGW